MKALGFSNFDASKQILILYTNDNPITYEVVTHISRANQTISVYHGDTLVMSCVMPSETEEDPEYETLMKGEMEIHDESFKSFFKTEGFTIVAGDETFADCVVVGGNLYTLDRYSFLGIIGTNGFIRGCDLSRDTRHQKFSISKKVSTTKKLYDTKLLSEDLLPKSVVKQKELGAVKSTVQKNTTQINELYDYCDACYSAANTAQSTAETAQSTAETAQSTAETAQSTANTAKTTAETAQSTAAQPYSGIFRQTNNERNMSIEGAYIYSGNTLHVPGSRVTGLKLYAADSGAYNGVDIFVDLPKKDKEFAELHFKGTTKHVGYKEKVALCDINALILNSSTPDSTKRFKITVDDTGALTATEITE